MIKPVRESTSYPAQGRLFGEFLCGLWGTACDVLAVPVPQAIWTTQVLRAALPPWARERIGTTPSQPSYVSDDGFPAEMSVNWSGKRPELRILFDRLGDTRDGTMAVDRRWRRIHEIFTSQAGRPSSAPLWHSIAWRPPSKMVHKTYVGLYAWPVSQRYAAVSEAMERLGMAAVWDKTRARVEEVDGSREIEFFAVDLADEVDARVKIYYRNHDADIGEVHRVASVALRHDAEGALAAYRTLAGDRTDAGEAALTCLAFRADFDQAAESTTYLRLSSLTSDDQEAVDRTSALLRREGVDPGRFRALAAALVPGRLKDSKGCLELVSYRAAGRRGDITTYFRFPVFRGTKPHSIS